MPTHTNSPLTFVEVIRAHGTSEDGLKGVVILAREDRPCQLLVQDRWTLHHLTQNHLQIKIKLYGLFIEPSMLLRPPQVLTV